MKKLLYTLSIIMLISSCRSIDKMIEQGKYDEAFHFGAEKLAGKKKKKTKHVKGLEEAFYKLNKRDLAEINFLDASNRPENWEKTGRIVDLIASRQARIEPMLPLISKEGYVAHFELIDVYTLKNRAIDGSAEFYYTEAQKLLELSESKNDKRLARRAYDNLKEVERFRYDYRESYLLKEKALEMGKVNIVLSVVNNANVYLPLRLDDELRSLNLGAMNSIWRTYHFADEYSGSYDQMAVLEITGIETSPERETITVHTDEKEVKDGWRYKKGKDGKPALDTLGKRIKVDKFKTVSAEVTELFREKLAYVEGRLKVTDPNNRQLASRPLSVEVVFTDYASTYRGDKRAVCDKDHSRIKEYPIPFPSDNDMIADAVHKLKIEFNSSLREIRI